MNKSLSNNQDSSQIHWSYATVYVNAKLFSSQYQHDGSEVLGDQFLVRGIAGDKESVPAVVRILVNPVNDEPPHIVNNTGLVLWEGSTAIITPTHLGTSAFS
jgi:hypothetical protein